MYRDDDEKFDYMKENGLFRYPPRQQLENFAAVMPDDPAQREFDFVCQSCGERVCTIEHADTLDTLVRVAISHVCRKEG